MTTNNNTGYIHFARYLTALRGGQGRGQIPAPLGHVPPFLRRDNANLANASFTTRIALTGTPFPSGLIGGGPVPLPQSQPQQPPLVADAEAEAEDAPPREASPPREPQLPEGDIPRGWVFREDGSDTGDDAHTLALPPLSDSGYSSGYSSGYLTPPPSPPLSFIFPDLEDLNNIDRNWDFLSNGSNDSSPDLSLVFPAAPSDMSSASQDDMYPLPLDGPEPAPEAGQPARRHLTNADVSLFSDVREPLRTHADAEGHPVLLDLICMICLGRFLEVPEPVAPRREAYVESGREVVNVLPCGHFFGGRCNHRWMAVTVENGAAPHCPMCRAPTVYEECRHRVPTQVADGETDVPLTIPEGGQVAKKCSSCDPDKPAGSW
ncbi:hypothetical protein F4820DRAFT_444795 [Hypoxylon rubiginosum]|uniref:Uncharacterized protein n=1 Tax=Hypoxylon rubiginosum TaxID=110542 RepID=A0ACB9ZAV6_9PEZI|nr:hypothetical protein F4820DRAFT_444795 [Hypoxylon rubiginosum]